MADPISELAKKIPRYSPSPSLSENDEEEEVEDEVKWVGDFDFEIEKKIHIQIGTMYVACICKAITNHQE